MYKNLLTVDTGLTNLPALNTELHQEDWLISSLDRHSEILSMCILDVQHFYQLYLNSLLATLLRGSGMAEMPFS